MFERTRVGGALYTFCDRARGDKIDRAALKALTDPFMPVAIQDAKSGLKADQAAASLIFRIVNHFSHEKFLEVLLEKQFDAFSALVKVYAVIFAEVSNNPTYFSHALSLFRRDVHLEIQDLVLNAQTH